MASCLLSASRRADHLLLRSTYTTRAPLRNILSLDTPRNDTTRRTRHRELSTSAIRKDYHFDTHHFVQRLEREGLTRGQAEGVMSSMAEVIDESIRTMTRNMVTKSEQEKVSNGHRSSDMLTY